MSLITRIEYTGTYDELRRFQRNLTQKPGMFRTWRKLSKVVFLSFCVGALGAAAFSGCCEHKDELSRLKGRDGLVYDVPTFTHVAPMPDVVGAYDPALARYDI